MIVLGRFGLGCSGSSVVAGINRNRLISKVGVRSSVG